MLSFHRKEQPDQVYRLWMAIFAHAGYSNVLVQYMNRNDVNNNLRLARKAMVALDSLIYLSPARERK